MCNIIVIENNKKLERKILEENYNINNDGIGIAVIKNNSIYFKKFIDFNKFYEFYKNTEYDKCVIHFRLKTNGNISLTNAHPFVISFDNYLDVEKTEGTLKNNEYLLFHNGIVSEIDKSFNIIKLIYNLDLDDKDYSDTKKLAILLSLLKNEEKIEKLLNMLSDSNKFALVDSKGNIKLFGNFYDCKDYKCSSILSLTKYEIYSYNHIYNEYFNNFYNEERYTYNEYCGALENIFCRLTNLDKDTIAIYINENYNKIKIIYENGIKRIMKLKKFIKSLKKLAKKTNNETIINELNEIKDKINKERTWLKKDLWHYY